MFNFFIISTFLRIQNLVLRLSGFLLTVTVPVFFSVSSPGQTAMAGEPAPLTNGARVTVAEADANASIFVEVLTQPGKTMAARLLSLDDVPAFLFGLTREGKVGGDEWTLFYNNLVSPDKSVEIITRELDPSSKVYKTVFRVDLSKVPGTVNELSLALATSLEGGAEDPMVKDLEFITTVVRAGENKIAVFSPQAGSLSEERAIFLLTFYRHGQGWKIKTQGDGYKGGFADLFNSFGGERSDKPEETAKDYTPSQQPAAPEPAVPQSPPSPSPIQSEQEPAATSEKRSRVVLEKLERKAPALVSLARKVNALVDELGLGNIVADVLLVLDGSGSMWKQYPDGIQRLVNRLIPLALRLDPDGAIPCYAFASHCARLSIDPTTAEEVGDNITLENYAGFIRRAQQSRMPFEQETQGGFSRVGGKTTDKLDALGNKVRKPYSGDEIFPGLGYQNEEIPLLELLRKDYARTKKPVLAIFVHDGGVGNSSAIKAQIRLFANEGVPIYFQIVGWAGSNYGALEELDTLEGRRIDNAGFLKLTDKDLAEMPDDVLIGGLLKGFAGWIPAAEKEKIIEPSSCRGQLL